MVVREARARGTQASKIIFFSTNNFYRYETRVDYIFCNMQVLKTWNCVKVENIGNSVGNNHISDHDAVSAVFELKSKQNYCYTCDLTLNLTQYNEHISGSKHKRRMNQQKKGKIERK